MKTKIDQLLAKVDRVLDRYLADGTDVTNFARHRALRWDGARRMLMPISRPVHIHPNHLLGINAIKHEVLRNTSWRKSKQYPAVGRGARASRLL